VAQLFFRFMPNRNIIAGILLAVLALTLWHFVQPTPSYELRFTQLTFDPGLAASPAISPDGRMVAYASDRDTGSNLELYVQPARGGSPRRLTTGVENHSDPAFSPDGATVAFYSTDDGGGISTVPAAGGDSHPIAPGGHTPRYSPDGRWIAYANKAGAYIVASTGGTARKFHPEYPSLRAPAWSPDGASLLFWAQDDLWVAPLDGGTPESTGIRARLAKARIGDGPFADALWTKFGLIFSTRTGLARNIYRCPLGRDGKTTGGIVRLTNGTELMGDASVSAEGRVVFSSGRQRFDIWGIPLDGDSGKAKGPPYRITDTLAPTANPDISADGKRLIFGSSRNGFTEIWEKDLISGKEQVAVTSAEGASYGRLLKAGSEILSVHPMGNHEDVYLGHTKLAVGTRSWDANSTGTTVLVSGAGIDALDVAAKQRQPLIDARGIDAPGIDAPGIDAPGIDAPGQTKLSDASFSPDDRWVVFAAETKDNSRIYVVPAHGGKWQPIAVSANRAGKPRFSPNGRLLYFTLDRDGNREIAAVRFEPKSGISGEPFTVFRPAAARLSLLSVNPQALDIAVAMDRLVTIFCEQTAAIWIGDLVPLE